MKRALPLPILLSALLIGGCSTHRYVASSFPDGKPEAVIYLKGKQEREEKVMEKVYFANGQLEHVGHFQDGKEQGEWNYFSEDGTRKFTEHWDQGQKDGVQIEYAPDGQVYQELYYEKGRLARTVDHTKD